MHVLLRRCPRIYLYVHVFFFGVCVRVCMHALCVHVYEERVCVHALCKCTQ